MRGHHPGESIRVFHGPLRACALLSVSAETQVKTSGDRSELPFRGGSYNGNGVGAGVFALNLNNPRSNSNWDVGFRAALLSQPDASDLRVRRQRREIKGVCLPAFQRAKNKNLMNAASNPACAGRTPQRMNPAKGTNHSCLFAAAIGIMVSGPVCSRSTSITRARTAMVILVSAPLYPHCQIFKAHGLCLSTEGIKGFVSCL